MTSYNVTNFNWIEMVGSSLVVWGVKTLGLPCRELDPGQRAKISWWLQPEKKKKLGILLTLEVATLVWTMMRWRCQFCQEANGKIKFIFLSSLHCEAQQKSCRCIFVTQLFRCLCLYTDLKTESSIATMMNWK